MADDRSAFPTAFQKKTLWAALTGLSFVVIGAVAVGCIWLTTRVFVFLQPVLVPLALAGIIAYLLDPLVEWLARKGLGRKNAVLVVFAAFNLAVILLALAVIPASLREANQLYQSRAKIQKQVGVYIDKAVRNLERDYPFTHPVTNLIFKARLKDPGPVPAVPGQEGAAQAAETRNGEAASSAPAEAAAGDDGTAVYRINWEGVTTWLSDKYELLLSKGWAFVSRGLGGVFVFFGYLVGILLVPIYLFYFLKESSAIASSWQDYLPLRASRFKDEVVETLQEINGYLIAFFRGQMVVSMIDGLLISICLALIGMPYSVLIGVFVAILGLIPYIGNLLCLIPAVLISIAHFSSPENQLFGISQVWIYPLIVVGIFLVTQQINSLFTAPRIVGDSVGLHPFTVIFSVLFWSLLLGGFLGALLAVPLTASIKVLFRRYIWQRRISPELPAPSVSSA